MTFKKTSSGEYEGLEIKDGYTVTCEASAQSYHGFSYTIRVNGHIISDDGYTGLRLRDIKQMVCSDWMVEGAIEFYKKGY